MTSLSKEITNFFSVSFAVLEQHDFVVLVAVMSMTYYSRGVASYAPHNVPDRIDLRSPFRIGKSRLSSDSENQ